MYVPPDRMFSNLSYSAFASNGFFPSSSSFFFLASPPLSSSSLPPRPFSTRTSRVRLTGGRSGRGSLPSRGTGGDLARRGGGGDLDGLLLRLWLGEKAVVEGGGGGDSEGRRKVDCTTTSGSSVMVVVRGEGQLVMMMRTGGFASSEVFGRILGSERLCSPMRVFVSQWR